VRRTVILIAAVAMLAAAAPASATFPGRNGLVAYGAKDGVHVMRPDGTRDRIVSRVAPATDAEWGPRGNRIAFSSRGSLYVVDVATGRTRRLTYGRYDRHPSWSPNAALIVYGHVDGQSEGIWIMRLSDGWRRMRLGDRVDDIELSPDGRWIAYFGLGGDSTRVSLHRLDRSGPERIVARFPGGDGAPQPVELAWSPDSRELAINTEANAAACDGCEKLFTVNVDGSGRKAVTSDGVAAPFYSPDGKSLAYCSFGYGGPHYEFFMQQQALVHHGDHYVGPTCGESWQARP
jgi:Tol biopolymer transport system component